MASIPMPMDWTSPRCACSSTSSSSAASPRRRSATASPNRRRRRGCRSWSASSACSCSTARRPAPAPTPAGVRLAPACADVVAAAAALVDRAETVADEQQRLVVAATRHVADHFLPGVDRRRRPRRRPRRPRRGRHARRRPGRACRRGRRSVHRGPGAPLGLRSEVVASEEIVPVVGRRHPWYGRRRGGRRPGPRRRHARPARRRGSGTLDVVDRRPRARSSSARSATASRSPARPPRACAALNGGGGRVPARLPRRRRHRSRHARCRSPCATCVIEQPVRAVWRGMRPPAGAARRLLAAARTALSAPEGGDGRARRTGELPCARRTLRGVRTSASVNRGKTTMKRATLAQAGRRAGRARARRRRVRRR